MQLTKELSWPPVLLLEPCLLGTICLSLTLSGCTPSSWTAGDQPASACKAVGGIARVVEDREGLTKQRGRLNRDNWASGILYQSITFIVSPDRRRGGNDKSQ